MALVPCEEFFMLNTEQQTKFRTGANPTIIGILKQMNKPIQL